MGLKELLFPKKNEKTTPIPSTEFQIINGYIPSFRSWNGEIYESQFVKSAIDAIARHVSKLAVTIEGGTKSELMTALKKAPNQFHTWSQFLYRLSTILEVRNTAFIIPLRDKFGTVIGIYPLYAVEFSLVEYNGELWVRFLLADNQRTAEKLSEIGILTRYQYRSDFFGDSNAALDETMQLISIQRQGIQEYTKNANSYRFYAKAANFSKSDDLAKERQRFDVENFQQSNGGGILLFPNTYNEIHQMSSQSFAIDTEELKLIEGAIEPLAIQLSEVMTRMLFTPREIALGSGIFFTSNRIQYMNNSDKLNVSRDLADRGVLSINEVREIWQLPPIKGGDIHILRGEYYNTQTGEKVEQIGDDSDEE